MDWDDLRTFLAISRHGSLSAAARALGVTQTTMGRRLEALHARAGALLLQRTPRGFVLTPAGERVLANVERMEAEALTVERAITGQDVRLEGTVRITTVEVFGTRILAPSLGAFHARYPGITIELDMDARNLSLSRREADIAVRLGKFEQHEVVVRKAGEMGFAVYAATDYLERRGIPDLSAGAAGHDCITLLPDLLTLPEAVWFASLTHKAHPTLRTNSRNAQLEAAAGGLGLVCLPRYLADSEPRLRRLVEPSPAPVRDIWIGTHRDIRETPRIRAASDFVSEVIRAAAPVLRPPD